MELGSGVELAISSCNRCCFAALYRLFAKNTPPHPAPSVSATGLGCRFVAIVAIDGAPKMLFMDGDDGGEERMSESASSTPTEFDHGRTDRTEQNATTARDGMNGACPNDARLTLS